jgi:phosphoribosylanthranilate isomerase
MARTRIKICGLTRVEDIDAAVAAGADALGFVFYPPSPRSVDIERAAQLIRRVPPFVTKVGLFVNEAPDTVNQVISELPIDLLQFHGEEAPDYCAAFQRPWIKAARMRPGVDLLEFAARYGAEAGCIGVLVDAFVEGYGGAGVSFDWSLLPHKIPLPLVLSGGLDPDNVEQAVRRIKPWAVDVSSGVEVAKGVKSAVKIEQFIRGVRNADAGPSL